MQLTFFWPALLLLALAPFRVASFLLPLHLGMHSRRALVIKSFATVSSRYSSLRLSGATRSEALVHPSLRHFHLCSVSREKATVGFSSSIRTPGMMGDQTEGETNENHSEYEKWVRTLYQTNMFHPVKMGLQNIEALYNAMGRPLDEMVVVHIAGTNGKGSVALKIAKVIELSNPTLRVGLFCSPHVSSFRERMQVNGDLISEEEVVELLPKVYQLCREGDIPATYFEIATALAFSFYAARRTDVVVLETGLGGRLDATNILLNPALAVITSIGLEHTRILGDTIELIAREKGGIIKAGRPVLVGPNVPHEVLRSCAVEKQASQYITCEDVLGSSGVLCDAEQLDYDIENSRIATAAIKLIESSIPGISGSIPESVIREGTSIRPPCRFEPVELEDGLQVILDVAHNPPAMEYMVRKLKATYPDKSVRVVVGMSSDKDMKLCGDSVLSAVDSDISRIHLVEAAHPRAAKLEDMLDATSFANAHYDKKDPSVTRQIEKALVLAKERGELLVVCGSVFLMAEAREALGFDEPRDSAYIAEVAGAGVRHSQENFGNNTVPSN